MLLWTDEEVIYVVCFQVVSGKISCSLCKHQRFICLYDGMPVVSSVSLLSVAMPRQCCPRSCYQADRLLDLGFEKKMEEIVGIIDKRLEEARSGERQTVLLSATMHNNLGRLATLSLRSPISIGFRSNGLDMFLFGAEQVIAAISM
eukprot:scaffold253721_cov16-Prasinocladus_malaysianus.AAC.1